MLGDRYGAKPVLIDGHIVQAIAILAFASRLGEFYALALVFGMAYGGTMPCMSMICVR